MQLGYFSLTVEWAPLEKAKLPVAMSSPNVDSLRAWFNHVTFRLLCTDNLKLEFILHGDTESFFIPQFLLEETQQWVFSKFNRLFSAHCSGKTFTFMHSADAFIQSELQLHSGYTFLISICVPWESIPQHFVLLTQCSTTEPHRNTLTLLWKDFEKTFNWYLTIKYEWCLCKPHFCNARLL